MISFSSSLRPIPRIVVVVFLLLFCWDAHDGAAQQSKPNLSGTWKLNRAKTKRPPWWQETKDYSCVIKHSEPTISMTHIFEGGTETDFYLTDGKERMANSLHYDEQIRAKTYWVGNTLVIESHRERGGFLASVWTSRYELSEDGKILLESEHFLKSSSSDKPFDVFRTFEKQPR
ncbi:MAG: hypothetical protein LAO03_11830 [Acidobacteriia bacterium]|nr:hypothetical protein [Terriglobia bacterium]